MVNQAGGSRAAPTQRKMHLLVLWRGTELASACGRLRRAYLSLLVTEDRGAVTCRACLAEMGGNPLSRG